MIPHYEVREVESPLTSNAISLGVAIIRWEEMSESKIHEIASRPYEIRMEWELGSFNRQTGKTNPTTIPVQEREFRTKAVGKV